MPVAPCNGLLVAKVSFPWPELLVWVAEGKVNINP
jgi:hypothetical protein